MLLGVSSCSFGGAFPSISGFLVSGRGVLSNRRASRDLITSGLLAKLGGGGGGCGENSS